MVDIVRIGTKYINCIDKTNKIINNYKPIGAAPRGIFCGGGGVFGQKSFQRSVGYGFPRRKKSSASRQYCKCILIDSKLCHTILHITIPYCNIVPYYVKSIAICHIVASAGMPHPSRPRRGCYRSAANVSPPSSRRTGPSTAAIS